MAAAAATDNQARAIDMKDFFELIGIRFTSVAGVGSENPVRSGGFMR